MKWSELSISDRLNCVLFVLTVMGVVLAGMSLYVAQLTLDDAKETGREQKQQFNQQMNLSDKQFQQQTSQSATQFQQQTGQSATQFQRQTDQSATQFRKQSDQSARQFEQQIRGADESLRALTEAREELRQQVALLEEMQKTSGLQLDALKQQIKTQLETADIRPLPAITVECNNTVVFQKDSRDGVWSLDSSPELMDKDNRRAIVETGTWLDPNIYRIGCRVLVDIEGRVNLTGATLSVLAHSDGTVGLLRVPRDDDPHVIPRPDSSIDVFSGQTIAPKAGNGTRVDSFYVFVPKSHAGVQLEVIFRSANGGNLNRLVNIVFRAGS